MKTKHNPFKAVFHVVFLLRVLYIHFNAPCDMYRHVYDTHSASAVSLHPVLVLYTNIRMCCSETSFWKTVDALVCHVHVRIKLSVSVVTSI